MRRREFIVGLGGAAACPLAARAQQPALPVIGYLGVGTPEGSGNFPAAFRKGLSETGYVEGRNVTIEYRWAQNESDRLPELAADLARRRVAVITTQGGTSTVLAAKRATSTIPIVFSVGLDPVESGVVQSLNRPGGNATGVILATALATPKRLGLLHQMVPHAAQFALLVNSATVFEKEIADTRAAALAIGAQLEVLPAATSRDIDAAFARLLQKPADALIVTTSVVFSNRRVQIVTLATRHAVPAIYFDRSFTEVGGLMSYGSSIPEQTRQSGVYVGRILKGDKPADLPVMLPTKYEFVINLQTAKTLGIDVPPTLLAIADEAIE